MFASSQVNVTILPVLTGSWGIFKGSIPDKYQCFCSNTFEVKQSTKTNSITKLGLWEKQLLILYKNWPIKFVILKKKKKMFLWILWFLLKWFWSKFADIYIGWPALIVYSLSFVVFIPGSSLWIRESLHIKWSAVLCFVGQKLVYSVSMATFSPNQIVQLACISRHLRIVIVQYYFSMRLFWIDQLWVINQYHTNSPIWHASLANVIWLF